MRTIIVGMTIIAALFSHQSASFAQDSKEKCGLVYERAISKKIEQSPYIFRISNRFNKRPKEWRGYWPAQPPQPSEAWFETWAGEELNHSAISEFRRKKCPRKCPNRYLVTNLISFKPTSVTKPGLNDWVHRRFPQDETYHEVFKQRRTALLRGVIKHYCVYEDAGLFSTDREGGVVGGADVLWVDAPGFGDELPEPATSGGLEGCGRVSADTLTAKYYNSASRPEHEIVNRVKFKLRELLAQKAGEYLHKNKCENPKCKHKKLEIRYEKPVVDTEFGREVFGYDNRYRAVRWKKYNDDPKASDSWKATGRQRLFVGMHCQGGGFKFTVVR